MKLAGLGAAATLADLGPFASVVMGQDGTPHLIPEDKNLDPAWVASLTQRGEPEVFAGWDEQLKYIGMPIGGIGCGQLYLGGDGRLWLWDIFKSNYRREPDHGQRLEAMTICGHYTDPVAFGETYNKFNGADVAQGFAIRVRQGGQRVTRTLDHAGFPGVTFRGEYPIGKVTYADDMFPVAVKLEAFSPFIPLNAADSGLPATVMSFTVANTSDEPAEVDLVGWFQNATCPYTDDPALGIRRNRVVRADGRVTVLGTVEPPPAEDVAAEVREDILFADFEANRYEGWTGRGDAFGDGPMALDDIPPHARVRGALGESVVNSHNVRAVEGADQMRPDQLSPAADRLTGTLTSDLFTIDRRYISFLISGGGHPQGTCLNLLIDDEVVASVTGREDHRMRWEAMDVQAHAGRRARLQVIDSVAGGWGNICVDQITFTDRRPAARGDGLEQKHGYGSMALSLINEADGVYVWASPGIDTYEDLLAEGVDRDEAAAATKPLGQELVGGLNASVSLAPGESKTLDFAITWYFPDYNEQAAAPGPLSQVHGLDELRRHYGPQFNSAGAVAGYLATDRERLLGTTRLWNQTWYDPADQTLGETSRGSESSGGTLPYWLLDRSFISLDCVATQMLHWFDSGRLWAWEGVDCCPGTCTHVWHYAQGLARIFPELERAFREITDYGVAFREGSGLIDYRAENSRHEATDGQAGTILRVYREHQMSADDAFLRRLWPKVKKSVQFMLAKDPDGNGLIEGTQPHTLDAAWYGPMGWISSLYLASLAAGEAMANAVGDDAFARECRVVIERGRRNIVAELYDGEYFIHKPDPNVPDAIQSGKGCHIDQVLGQAWVHQVGLDRVVPKDETVSALQSLWRYNFAPDAGQYAIDHIEIEQAFRWYAMPGEAGLVMCSWPKGGAVDAIPGDRLRAAENPDVWTGPGGYFNECMNGFEYQVAAHMIYEGEPGSDLVEKGLAIFRAVHDRYAADKRNPYNEIECSDHYARSMASYGVFLAVCGFEYDGPAGHIGFAPKLTPDNFRAPFTAAQGWGTYHQKRANARLSCQIDLHFGVLRVKTFAAELTGDNAKAVRVRVNDNTVRRFSQDAGRIRVEFDDVIDMSADDSLRIEIDVQP